MIISKDDARWINKEDDMSFKNDIDEKYTIYLQQF